MLLKLSNLSTLALLSTDNNMKQFFLKLGRFFRVIDDYGTSLSITNIAYIIILVKIALAAEPSVADLGGLLVAMLAYHGKKHLNKDLNKSSEDQSKILADLQVKVKEASDKASSVAAMVGIKNLK